MGCSLLVEEGGGGAVGDSAVGGGAVGGANSDLPALTVTGNRCPRGAAYAQEEIRSPRRVVTATCAIAGGTNGRGLYAPRRVPVKTLLPCPREKIPALLADIYKTKISLPVKAGDAVIADWKGEGISVIAVRTIS
jgi:CxxC motif-containing protein